MDDHDRHGELLLPGALEPGEPEFLPWPRGAGELAAAINWARGRLRALAAVARSMWCWARWQVGRLFGRHR